MMEFNNLRAGYDGVEKLHEMDGRLERGRLTAIIGPNGCGKSTLIKCCAGLLKPMGGEIRLDGVNLYAIPEKERARSISYMPQSRITPDISVKQLVTHGRYPHMKWGQSLRGEDKDIINASIERVKLTGYAGKQVSRLSGGERQRAYLAMMLAQQSDIMLLDEPTTYLDLSSQFALMELLQKLRDEGRGIAVVLHDLALALEYADEIMLMRRGKLVISGSPEEVYQSGEIQRAFAVEIRRAPDEKYTFYPAGQEEII